MLSVRRTGQALYPLVFMGHRRRSQEVHHVEGMSTPTSDTSLVHVRHLPSTTIFITVVLPRPLTFSEQVEYG